MVEVRHGLSAERGRASYSSAPGSGTGFPRCDGSPTWALGARSGLAC